MYVAVLLKTQDRSGAVRNARELHVVLIAKFSPSNGHSISAAIELAIFLEQRSSTYAESVPTYTYKHVCRLLIDISFSDADY